MTPELGRHQAMIVKHDVRATPGGTMFVHILMEIEGNQYPCPIWLTDKNLKRARIELKVCGFDSDKSDLKLLKEKPELMAGRHVPVELLEDDYKGRTSVKCQIITERTVSDSELSTIQERMRKGKTEPEANGITDEDLPF